MTRFLLLFLASFAYGQTPTLLFEDPLNGSTRGVRYGGEFVAGGGWRAVDDMDRLWLMLPRAAGDGSYLEMDIRNLNVPAQIDLPENHMLGLWERPFASGGDASRPGMDCFVMFAGKKYPQFKLKYHTTGFARHETTYQPLAKFDPERTYKLRIAWKDRKFTVALDGKVFFDQISPQMDPMERVAFIHIGANWQGQDPVYGHPALKGPVYSNVKVYAPVPPEGAPTDLRIMQTTPSSVTLTWAAPPTGKSNRYVVQRGGKQIGETSNPAEFVDSRLPQGIYTYRVGAKEETGSDLPRFSNEVTAYVVDNRATAARGKSPIARALLSKPLAGKVEGAARFGTAWDETNLYLVAEVDRVPRPGDAIEVSIDGNNNGAPSLYAERKFDAHDRHYMVKLDGKSKAALTIPWADLGVKPAGGMVVGLEVRYHQEDGPGKKSITGWSSENLDPKITSAFGDLVLSEN